MSPTSPWRICALALILGLPACRGPRVRPCPLVPEAVLAEVRRERAPEPGSASLDLVAAAERLRRHNPELRAARAAWRTRQAVADVPTPLANPSLGAGPLLLGGTDIVRIAQVGVEAGIGWAIPLTPRRRLQDDLNDEVALAAFVDAAAAEREAYLALRSEQVAAVLEEEIRVAHREVEGAAEEAAGLMRRLAEAGEVSELDVNLLELEAEEFRTQGLELERDAEQALVRWRARIAAEGDALRPDPSDLPNLPPELPPTKMLESVLLRDHPELARLRASYRVAEKALRVEAVRAIPDLNIEAAFEDEVEIQKLGLPLSIELPIFDRNQGGIAEAYARRDEVRERYAAALSAALGRIDAARRRILRQQEIVQRYARQHDMGEEMAALARRAVEAAGTVDLPRYLEVLRASRRIRVEELDARAALFGAWLELEAALGAPVLHFRHEGLPIEDDLAEVMR